MQFGFDDGINYESYAAALICNNGHVITNNFGEYTQHDNYCQECGAELSTLCPNCGEHYRGEYTNSTGMTYCGSGLEPKKYCHKCGMPYPWTQSAIEAAIELAKEDEFLTEEDVKLLSDSIKDITIDSPKTELAATRIKKVLVKAGGAVASSMQRIIVDIASEAARKALLG